MTTHQLAIVVTLRSRISTKRCTFNSLSCKDWQKSVAKALILPIVWAYEDFEPS